MTFTVAQATTAAQRQRQSYNAKLARIHRARHDRALPEDRGMVGLSSSFAMPAIKMHVTPWTVDELGNRTREIYAK